MTSKAVLCPIYLCSPGASHTDLLFMEVLMEGAKARRKGG